MYALKSVKHIVLRKGGQQVTFITHAPFNKIRYIDAPLKNVSGPKIALLWMKLHPRDYEILLLKKF